MAEGNTGSREASRIVPFIGIIQGLLFLAHGLVYETVNYFWGKPHIAYLAVVLIVLSLSFVPASMVVWRYSNVFATLFYRMAAIWLGCLSFFFSATIVCWAVYGCSQILRLQVPHRPLLVTVFGIAFVGSLAALANGAWIRVTRITVKLAGLPESWRGRTAVLAGDLHLGPVRGRCYAQRIVRLAKKLKPEVVFLTGDFYDGTAVDETQMAETWKDFPAPLGMFYVTGNHEEFTDRRKYLRAVESAGIQILDNRKITLDGVQICGVLYGEASDAETFGSKLKEMNLNHGRPSILLSHVPQYLNVAEESGVSLQLSGHTHNGQVLPWVWIARRVHGPFVYGLNQFKKMLVYTTSGAGTWGPPMRLGTRSEIVLIRFEQLSQ